MLGEPRLNVCILDPEITPRLRERLQAQVEAALRSLPPWSYKLLTRRMEELGVAGVPLVVEPVHGATAPQRPLSLGHIEDCPAARLLPRISGENIEWGQDRRYLVGKALAFMAAPAPSAAFWQRWEDVIDRDRLRHKASNVSPEWDGESSLGLFIEMFAAYALNAGDVRWSQLPSVHAFLQEWRDDSA